ncbi:ATP-binding protein [bacterium]|nr:ATP-binding protein [bacterium]
MKIAIASGKGGTGKTLISTNLAWVAREDDPRVVYLDCDVEEPNGHLFLKGEVERSRVVNRLVPEINNERCDGCSICSDFCAFNALATLKESTLVFPELCHSCGGCALVCPNDAIVEVEHPVGTVRMRKVGELATIDGIVNIGVSSVTPVIQAVKQSIPAGSIALLDASPGTACPAVETLKDCDFVLLITEPTPFGLNDFQLSVELLRELKVPFAAMINRVGVGDNRVHDYCQSEGIQVLAELPNDRRIAEVYSRGELITEGLPEYRAVFERLYAMLLDRCPQNGMAMEKSNGTM